MADNENKKELSKEELESVNGGRAFYKSDKKCPQCGKVMACNINEWTLETKYFCRNCGYGKD